MDFFITKTIAKIIATIPPIIPITRINATSPGAMFAMKSPNCVPRPGRPVTTVERFTAVIISPTGIILSYYIRYIKDIELNTF